MALTISNLQLGVSGNKFTRTGSIAFDSSYPTGGEPLSKTALHLSENVTVDLFSANPKSGYVFEYDYANSKLLVYYGDNNNENDSPLIQVPDEANLGSLTGVRFRVEAA